MTVIIKELKPIKESTEDYEKIEIRIKRIFRKFLYDPLLKSLSLTPSKKVINAKKGLFEALQSGQVTYSNGSFRGNFNASISKELREMGAKWDKKISGFKLPEKEMSYPIRQAIGSSQVSFAEKMSKIDKKLSQILPEDIAEQLKTADLFDSTLWKVDQEFQQNLSKVKIEPKLSSEMRAKIADEWQNNMNLWIKDFSEKQIKELRQMVQNSIMSGNRYESLIKSIKSSYDVTTRKAKFLARQETALLMTKFKETRYREAGVNEYRWGCVKMPHDSSPNQHTPGNVRYSHGILEGQIFRWDNPPITSSPGEPMRRNNAGADYNCRCFARPIVRFFKDE